MDKRFIEVISQVNEPISSVRTENRNVRLEMNQRLSDMQSEISKLNQNHIDHLSRHHD